MRKNKLSYHEQFLVIIRRQPGVGKGELYSSVERRKFLKKALKNINHSVFFL